MHKSKKNEIFQLKNIYESTIQFEKFINENKGFENIKTVLDAGCGIGSNSYFFSKKNPSINFVGGDLVPKWILRICQSFEKLEISHRQIKD